MPAANLRALVGHMALIRPYLPSSGRTPQPCVTGRPELHVGQTMAEVEGSSELGLANQEQRKV